MFHRFGRSRSVKARERSAEEKTVEDQEGPRGHLSTPVNVKQEQEERRKSHNETINDNKEHTQKNAKLRRAKLRLGTTLAICQEFAIFAFYYLIILYLYGYGIETYKSRL